MRRGFTTITQNLSLNQWKGNMLIRPEEKCSRSHVPQRKVWQLYSRTVKGWRMWITSVTAHWPVGWTILVSGYTKLVQWLSLCYHVSYEPGSISLLRSKAVIMTTSWQSVWQPYRHTNVKGSHPDNFIVVSLTTLQVIKWCQAFCCDGCSAVH